MTRAIREALVVLAMVVLVFVCLAFAVTSARQTAATPQGRTSAPEQPSASDGDQEVATGGTAEADEALQQLIAQAEALAGADSSATAEATALINEELEALQAGLALKASLLDEGQDTKEADLEIASASESLEAAIAAVTEPGSSSEPPQSHEKARDDRVTVIARANGYVTEALSLLSRIQALLLIHRDEAAGADPDIPSDAGASEEVLQDVTGVVMESGEPLEGVSVMDPESGVTAVTDAEGQYALQGVPAGRSARLVLSKAGTQVGEGQLDLAAGRDGVGDFELKPSAGRSRPSLRVLPYMAVVRGTKTGTGNRGSLTGTLRDADGRPVSRALVSLGTLARARTNSKGQYTFLGVPAGAYALKAFKPGFPIETKRVRVDTARVDATFALRPRSARRGVEARPLVREKGAGIQMRGAITSAAGPPIRAAKVTLMQSGKAVSVRSGPRGDFLFSDLQAGRYRVLVSKPGYQSLAETVSLETGGSQVRNYRLKRTATRASITSKPKTGASAPAGVGRRAAAVLLAGRVLDAATRRPVAGAVVSIGATRIATDSAGHFTVPALRQGDHRIVIRAAGYQPASESVTLGPDDRTASTFTLTRVAAPGKRQ
jgi:protocatechuate 3,4-dioxygenase beta subunit